MYANVLNFDSPIVVDKVQVNENIFSQPYRPDVLNMVVRWQLAKRRSGCHKTKGISDISGTTRKPYRQKGTGRARQGSLRSPQFRGGAVIFGPVVRSHAFSLNKKFRMFGLKVALSLKFSNDSLYYFSGFLPSGKTSDLRCWIDSHQVLKSESSILFVVGSLNQDLKQASLNMKKINVLPVIGLNVYDLLRYDNVLIAVDAAESLDRRFGLL